MAFRPIKTREEFRAKRDQYLELLERVKGSKAKRWTNDRRAMGNIGQALTNYAHRQYVKGYGYRACAEQLPTSYLSTQLFEIVYQSGKDVKRAIDDLTFVGPQTPTKKAA